MSKRKITKTDVDQAYETAQQARTNALFSLRRARQLKDGADKMKKEYNANKRRKK